MYQNNLGFGGAQHRFFAPFHFTQWDQSHQTWAIHDISWIYTYPHISHPSPHSSNPGSLGHKGSASLRYFSWLGQMKHARGIERDENGTSRRYPSDDSLFSKGYAYCRAGTPPGSSVCPYRVPWNARAREAIRVFIQTSQREAPSVARHHTVSVPQCRVRLPVRLSHGRADRGEYCRRGAASCCCCAILRIPECRWDDVGNGGYRWAGPG